MTVCQNKDLLSNIQSSYLWESDEQQWNNPTDIPTEDLNICDGLQQAVSPRFNTVVERSQLTSARNVLPKEATAISLSEMCLKSSEETKSRRPWTPTNLLEENSQMPMIEQQEQQSSRFALLAKTGRPICRIRLSTIAFPCLILALCGIAIGVPMAFISKISNTPRTSTTTTTTTSTTTSTTSTSTTTTTTTPPATGWIPMNYYTSCSVTCISVSTVTPSTLLAAWTFEGHTYDVSNNGNDGEIVNGAAFTTGYVGQAILLRRNNTQFVNASYINLANQSFTVEAWIYLNSAVPGDFGILGECELKVIDHCLHYIVRQNRLYMGFYGDDLFGTTNLSVLVWYHVAFVYDYSTNIKSIYLNGLLDGISAASGLPGSKSAFLGEDGSITIGAWDKPIAAYWDGLLDQLTITNRVKIPCEILNDASLVVHFPFDNNNNDIGPNLMTGTSNPQNNSGLSWVSGQVNQALSFNASNSYFESCGFDALGRDQSYSIAMWINPSFQSGTLFHLSSAATGSGDWCLPMIGFSSNGSIVVQTWQGSSVSIMGPILPINTWTHIVQTYSSTNGLRLYINGGLYYSAIINTFSSSYLTMCILLGSSGLGRNCQTGLILMGPYSGAIDEMFIIENLMLSKCVHLLIHNFISIQRKFFIFRGIFYYSS